MHILNKGCRRGLPVSISLHQPLVKQNETVLLMRQRYDLVTYCIKFYGQNVGNSISSHN